MLSISFQNKIAVIVHPISRVMKFGKMERNYDHFYGGGSRVFAAGGDLERVYPLDHGHHWRDLFYCDMENSSKSATVEYDAKVPIGCGRYYSDRVYCRVHCKYSAPHECVGLFHNAL